MSSDECPVTCGCAQADAGGPAGLVVPAAPGVAGRREGAEAPGEGGAAAEDREGGEEPLQVGPGFIHRSNEGKKTKCLSPRQS